MSTAIGAVIDRIHHSAEKATPDSNDELLIIDNTVTEYVQRKITWANLLTAIAVEGAAPTLVLQTDDTLDITATIGDYIALCDATAANITVNLPTAVGNTAIITVKKTDSSANTVTLDGSASQTIDGSTTAVISIQNVSLTLVSDGSNWNVI